MTARGITPACAGKTTGRGYGSVDDGDHPRVCGENLCSSLMFRVASGSPPRVRGKQGSGDYDAGSAGITPACAGKTKARRTRVKKNWDHPRVCGENSHGSPNHEFVKGSPPRVRGKHFGNGVFPWLILVLSLDPL